MISWENWRSSLLETARGDCRDVGEISLQHWFMLRCNPKDQGSSRDGDWHPVPSERDKEQETL